MRTGSALTAKDMNMFRFTETKIPGLTLIQPKYVSDRRGYMVKPFEKRIFAEQGIDFGCFEMMESCSSKGVLRGLHIQRRYPQAKLVRVVMGEIFDAAVDLREGSETFGQWQGFYLSDANRHMLYVPKGFAHGFLVVSESAVFSYMCDSAYRPEDEEGILWNDSDIRVEWPLERIGDVLISEKDQRQRTFRELYL
jgi:dTDP-4-dehydrorhamnose 3,5-epimerase